MRNVLIKVVVLLLRILASTWRIRVEGDAPKDVGIIIVWHGFMLVLWKYFAFGNGVGVTSKSKDGDVLAALLHSWHYKLIRGSSSQGGGEVLEQMIENSKYRKIIITPDGPRGPALVPKAGAFVAAQRTGVSLHPCIVTIRSAKYLKSWDSFAIPLPFTQCSIRFLPPIHVSPNLSREEITVLMESTSLSMGGNKLY